MRRIILDADPGVDDFAALLLALASPELSVLGVSTVAGNVGVADATTNALKALALAGRTDIPVHAGCAGPLVRPQIFGKHARLGAFPDTLAPPTATKAAPAHAVQFIASTAIAASAEGGALTICASGPLTNIATALALDERVATGIERIVVMGGAFTALGNRAPWAEMNILADPHAAYSVLTSGVPISLFPLDVTFTALMQDRHLAQLRARTGRAGRALADLFELSDRSDSTRFGGPGGPIHDIAPVAYLLRPELFDMRPAQAGVETAGRTMGHTYADFHGESAATSHVEIARSVDAEALISMLLDRLETYGAETAENPEVPA